MREAIEALYWNRIYEHKQRSAPEYDPWLDKHEELLKSSRDTVMIDLGCGSGANAKYLTERGYKVTACDLSEEALHIVSRFVPSASVKRFNMLNGLPFETSSARVIIADLSLHYFTWAETEGIVMELERVLQPDGVLLCRVNSTEDVEYGAGQGIEIEPYLYEQGGRCKRFFNEEQLRRLFEAASIVYLQKTTMYRYDLPKQCWELAVVFPQQ